MATLDSIRLPIPREGVFCHGPEEERAKHGVGCRSPHETELDRPQFRQDAKRRAVDTREQGGDRETGPLGAVTRATDARRLCRRYRPCARHWPSDDAIVEYATAAARSVRV